MSQTGGCTVAAIETRALTQRYGRTAALRDVTLSVPEGSFYALLGPNGAGKTTLLRLVAGLLTPSDGEVRVLGRDVRSQRAADRAAFTFVGESMKLPEWMTLAALEAYLAPLYDRWDVALANDLRARFRLPAERRLRTLSRGEQMKAALLCALAPRPRLLVMDEPFTGMDVLVKDDLVSGVLDIASAEGCTVLISSHDLAELELLADTVGFLDGGRLRLSASMDEVRARFRRVEVQLAQAVDRGALQLPPEWLAVEWSGTRASFMTSEPGPVEAQVSTLVPHVARVETRGASLREVFVAVARSSRDFGLLEEARQ